MLSLKLPDGALSELLYADDLVLMRETIEGLGNKFVKWKDSFESKCLKVKSLKESWKNQAIGHPRHHNGWHV